MQNWVDKKIIFKYYNRSRSFQLHYLRFGFQKHVLSFYCIWKRWMLSFRGTYYYWLPIIYFILLRVFCFFLFFFFFCWIFLSSIDGLFRPSLLIFKYACATLWQSNIIINCESTLSAWEETAHNAWHLLCSRMSK